MEIFKGWGGLTYVAVLLGLALALEAFFPWRRKAVDIFRWLRNLSMAFYGTIFLGLLPWLAGYGAALGAQETGTGLFNLISMPFWAELIAALLIIDAMVYFQHRALHQWYFLWRAHRTHHSDAHVDATTGLRFHPFETLFRAGVEACVIWMLGLPPEGILLSFGFIALANMTTHINLKLPYGIERAISVVLITPRAHRIHHSTAPEKLDANFGTVITLWDRMFGTWRGIDQLSDEEAFGLAGEEALPGESFANLVLDPFRKTAGAQIPKPVPHKGDDDKIAGAGA